MANSITKKKKKPLVGRVLVQSRVPYPVWDKLSSMAADDDRPLGSYVGRALTLLADAAPGFDLAQAIKSHNEHALALEDQEQA